MDVDIRIARQLATAHHNGVFRKYADGHPLPYISHPANVVKILIRHKQSNRAIIAAWLHDALEDPNKYGAMLDHSLVIENLGRACYDDICMITNVSKKTDGDRATRKQLDLEHLKHASPMMKTVKVADVQDNTHDLVVHNPAFAKVYIPEKITLLEEALRGANEALWCETYQQLLRELHHLQ
jgi:(p)ppGpp synthase/HD superfamily hydrolase